MQDITFAVTSFVVLGALAFLASVAIYATILVRFFAANRRVRVASHEPLLPYYRDGWRHGFPATV